MLHCWCYGVSYIKLALKNIRVSKVRMDSVDALLCDCHLKIWNLRRMEHMQEVHDHYYTGILESCSQTNFSMVEQGIQQKAWFWNETRNFSVCSLQVSTSQQCDTWLDCGAILQVLVKIRILWRSWNVGSFVMFCEYTFTDSPTLKGIDCWVQVS